MKIRLTRPLPTTEGTAAPPANPDNRHDLQHGALPLIMHKQDFFLDALQIEIDATQQMEQATTRNAYEQAVEKWRISRSLLNSMLRIGIDTEDKKGFPLINRVIASGVQTLKRYLRQVGFPVATPLELTIQHARLFVGLARNDEEGDQSIRTALQLPGINVNAIVDNEHNTALSLAAQQGMINSVKAILPTPGVNVNHINQTGKTPLHYAILHNQPEMVKALMEEGTDPNLPDQDGTTPLILGIITNRQKSLKALLEQGVDPNQIDPDGNTLLILATINNRPDSLKTLLKRGADPNVPNNFGKTPLHYAVRDRQPELVESLLSYSANRNLPDQDGQTPLDLAQQHYENIDEDDFDYADVIEIMQRLTSAAANTQ